MMFANKPTKWVILKRLRAIYDSPTKESVAKFLLDKLKGRKLMFAGGIEQSNRLSKNTFNSKTDDTKYKAFANNEIDHLICVNSGGTGHTYKEIDHLILVQANSDKGGETTQKVLRSMVKQGNRVACIWIICLTDTQDEKWVQAALENFDQKKVEYVRFINLKNQL